MKLGRNDPFPCGSGKKYKKCCYPSGQTLGSGNATGKQDGRAGTDDEDQAFL